MNGSKKWRPHLALYGPMDPWNSQQAVGDTLLVLLKMDIEIVDLPVKNE